MKTTVEEINDKLLTVVWHDKNANMKDGESRLAFYGSGYCIFDFEWKHIATALPALPRHPQPEDLRLLYRYAAEGIDVYGHKLALHGSELGSLHFIRHLLDGCKLEITHAIYAETGDRAEVAIVS